VEGFTLLRVHTPKHSFAWQWLYAVVLASVIVTASGRSQVAAPGIVDFDKAAHFAVFGLLATLVVRPLSGRRVWMAVVIVSLFGASDEVHQSLTPGRAMEFADWIADTSGAIVAVMVYTCWPQYRRMMETRLWKRKPKIEAGAVSATTVSAL
jgi:VanZ family protein